MTISSTTRKAGPFSGTGLQTAYPFAFKVFLASDMLVVLTDAYGVETVLALTTDYTVTLNGDQDANPGGTITMAVAPIVGNLLTISSAVPATQGQSIPNNGGFYPKVVEDGLDRVTIEAQQLAEQVSRSVKFAISDTSSGNDMPAAAQRANNLLGFDSDGNMVAVIPVAGSATQLQADLANGSDPTKGAAMVAGALTLTALAASVGAALVGWIQAGVGAVARLVQDKLRDTIHPKDFGAVGDGVTNDDAALALFFTTAVAKGCGVNLSGTYAITQLTIPPGIRHIYGDCTLVGAATGSYASVLEIKNVTDLVIDGTILVSAVYNTGYACGVRVWADTASGCSLVDLKGISVAGAAVGWQIGDPTQVDRLVSEITIRGGYTYGCPIACAAYGTQTFVNFIGYQLESGYGSGSGAWLSLSLRVVLAFGAAVVQTGGEALMTANTTGALVELDPIASVSYAHSYGVYRAVGVTMECASPFLVTGTAGVSSPVGGLFSLVQCTGIHTQNLQALIQTDANFTGNLVFSANDLYATVARTYANIAPSGAANIWCDDKSFGANFLSTLRGIGGAAGIPHFSQRLVLSVNNLAGQSLPNASNTVLKFTVVDIANDRGYYSQGYSASTGIFTTPASGLKNVQILASMALAGMTSAQLLVEINNVVTSGTATNVYGQTSLEIAQLNAGDQVKIVLFNISSGPLVANSFATDTFQIFASN